MSAYTPKEIIFTILGNQAIMLGSLEALLLTESKKASTIEQDLVEISYDCKKLREITKDLLIRIQEAEDD